MRGLVVIACLLTMCCATSKPRNDFEQLFDERAHAANQTEPYRPIDYELWRFSSPPQPDDIEVMRYVVAPDTSGSTAPPPAADPQPDPQTPDSQPNYDEGPWRPFEP